MTDRVRLTATVTTDDVMAVITALQQIHPNDPLAAVISATAAATVVGTRAFAGIEDPDRLSAVINDAAQELAEAVLNALDDTPDAATAGPERPEAYDA